MTVSSRSLTAASSCCSLSFLICDIASSVVVTLLTDPPTRGRFPVVDETLDLNGSNLFGSSTYPPMLLTNVVILSILKLMFFSCSGFQPLSSINSGLLSKLKPASFKNY